MLFMQNAQLLCNSIRDSIKQSAGEETTWQSSLCDENYESHSSKRLLQHTVVSIGPLARLIDTNMQLK